MVHSIRCVAATGVVATGVVAKNSDSSGCRSREDSVLGALGTWAHR